MMSAPQNKVRRGRRLRTIRGVMYADTILNLALMVGVLLCAPHLAVALRHESQVPVLGVAGLLGLSAAFHWMTGRSENRLAVKLMAVMDGSVLLTMLLLALFDPLAAPGWLRSVLVLGAMLALLMGSAKVLALRTSPRREASSQRVST